MVRKCGKSARPGGVETAVETAVEAAVEAAAGVGAELIVRFLKIEARDDTNRS
jgi:hypothetical protein